MRRRAMPSECGSPDQRLDRGTSLLSITHLDWSLSQEAMRPCCYHKVKKKFQISNTTGLISHTVCRLHCPIEGCPRRCCIAREGGCANPTLAHRELRFGATAHGDNESSPCRRCGIVSLREVLATRSGQRATHAHAPLAIALHERYYFCPATVQFRLKLQYICLPDQATSSGPWLLVSSRARLETSKRLQNKIHPGT